MRIVNALVTTMSLREDNLLLDWTRGNYRASRIRLHQPVLDVSTRYAATGSASIHLKTLMPDFLKNTWANSRRQHAFIGRDDITRSFDYNPHLFLHEVWSPDKMLSDAMPIYMDSGLLVMCSSDVRINGTTLDTKSSPTCGDVLQQVAIVGTAEGRILVYNTETATLQTIYKCEGHSPITSIRMASSSRLLATGHANGLIRVHTLSPRTFAIRQVGIKTYHTGSPVRRIRMDNKHMASSDDSDTIHVSSTIGDRVWWSRPGRIFDVGPNRLVSALGDTVDILHFDPVAMA